MLARRIILLLLTSAIALSGCKRVSIPPDVVARINDRMVTLADFKRYLERNAGTDLAQLTPEVASAMLDQYLEEVILSEHAARNGVEVPAERIAAAVRTEAGVTVVEKRDEMRRERLVSDLATAIPDATDAEVQAYYEKEQAEFRSGESVRVRQILVRDEALAREILQKLKTGAEFGELSAEHSLAPNAKRGGEIGFVYRGELPKLFEERIFALEPGELSEVIQTDNSFHVFRIDEKRPAGTLDLASATPLIRSRLREETLRNQVAQIVAQSRRQMTIAVLTRRLPFQYSGTLPKSEAE
ncbi:MAG TPA: peptidyl-prolyl cis-trans isomerase [Thermoanaerobaculia bacterium]